MAVYKDEILRNRLINRAKSRLEQFGWQGSALRVWDGILYSLQDY